jgi:hypothetical protein
VLLPTLQQQERGEPQCFGDKNRKFLGGIMKIFEKLKSKETKKSVKIFIWVGIIYFVAVFVYFLLSSIWGIGFAKPQYLIAFAAPGLSIMYLSKFLEKKEIDDVDEIDFNSLVLTNQLLLEILEVLDPENHTQKYKFREESGKES